MRLRRLTFRLLLSSLLVLPFTSSAVAEDDIAALSRLSVEELLEQDVTSVMRKEQPLVRAPSAIYVLNSADIRRSGATSIPEALRLIPGITVARTNANSWIVTARGFDLKGATKLLVLIDGRSVYSPFFSGVFWDVQEVMLNDIERIEVIRGPGAVHWGENAVNGVINIITKSSTDTQGLLAVMGGGVEEQAFANFRYGGKAAPDLTYRIYGKTFTRDSSQLVDGRDGEDDWRGGRAGFRMDTGTPERGLLTFQGDGYDQKSFNLGNQLQSYSYPFTAQVRNRTESNGGNVLARYTERISARSDYVLQGYYDRTYRRDDVSGEHRHTFDLDAHHHRLLGESHDVVYGANYRFSIDKMDDSFSVDWDPDRRRTHLFTTFVQDEIALVKRVWSVIPGTKLGYNTQSDFEYQPALKTVWSIADDRALWGSVSRAVRIPSRFDEDLRFPVGATEQDNVVVVPTIFGSQGFKSEKLLAYELGYRAEETPTWSYDIATYYHQYTDLFSLEPGAPFVETLAGDAQLIVPLRVQNGLDGEAYGIELTSTWKPSSSLRLTANYSHVELHLSHDQGSRDVISISSERRTPHHQRAYRRTSICREISNLTPSFRTSMPSQRCEFQAIFEQTPV